MRLSAERWQALIPYLDQALDLRVEQRLGWLAALREKDAGLAEEVTVLLEKHERLAREGFLEVIRRAE